MNLTNHNDYKYAEIHYSMFRNNINGLYLKYQNVPMKMKIYNNQLNQSN